jgi:hypothetical protein
MDKKSLYNQAQQNAQQTAMNHQLHISSINSLTELLRVVTAQGEHSPLRTKIEEALSALLDPFIPQPTSNIIQ